MPIACASVNPRRDGFGYRDSSMMALASLFFGRTRSKMTGIVMKCYLPHILRSSILGMFVKLNGIDMSEMEKSLKEYSSISDLFSRRLISEIRKVEKSNHDFQINSPVDGKLLHHQVIQKHHKEWVNWIPNVKGASYHVPTLIGAPLSTLPSGYQYHACVIYLSPSDYHHFHSPCNFLVKTRRHFSGEVFPVLPWFAQKINNLFALNERVSLAGEWEGGAMYYTAVAAYNVGDIGLCFDEMHKTNRFSSPKRGGMWAKTKNRVREIFKCDAFEFDCYGNNVLQRQYSSSSGSFDSRSRGRSSRSRSSTTTSTITSSSTAPMASEIPEAPMKQRCSRGLNEPCTIHTVEAACVVSESIELPIEGIQFTVGDEIGDFKLGSTIVLVFQAPDHFNLVVEQGSRVKLGQILGHSLQ
eukprot:GHVH01007057.1.p1 GENE.GHVH01007057.1~~GHVH01007057.1.p1  ORF type:complete len:412 (+),score=39.18 GHVH01007057.1:90-1325(+)